MKLTGWFRIGIVLSVLWCFFIIGFTIYQYNNHQYGYLVTLKSDTTKQIITTSQLMKLDDVVFDKPVIHYGNIFLSMIIPIVSGWLLVLTIVWTIKWVVRGFRGSRTI